MSKATVSLAGPVSGTRVSGFFFQAEGGIRDLTVTGVQTCALPISNSGCCASKSAQPAIRKETTLEAPMAEPGPPAASAENAFAARLFEDLPARYDLLAEVDRKSVV